MRRLTFDEFFALPEGVLFGQDYALPHRDSGLWRKGKSWESDFDDAANVAITDIIYPEGEATEFVFNGSIEDDHRFLVYEPGDLGRLAGIIEAARKATEKL